MRGDRTQAPGRVAGDLASGTTWQWDGKAWNRYDQTLTYHTRLVPFALTARVLAVDGATLTLDRPAVTAAAGATVHLDASVPFMDQFGRDPTPFDPQDCVVEWPAGRFAWGRSGGYSLWGSRDRWTYRGQGRDRTTIFSPRGTMSLNIAVSGADSVVEDFSFEGNARLDGAPFGTFNSNGTHALYTTNITLLRASGGQLRRIRSVDGFSQCISMSFCKASWGRDLEVAHTTGFDRYTQWLLQLSDCVGGGFEDCRVASPVLVPGINTFRSSDCAIRRVVVRNGLLAVNSCSNWLWEDVDVVIEAMSARTGFPTFQYPVVDINSNIDFTSGSAASGGGVFRRFRIIQQGPLNAVGDVLTTFNLSGKVENVLIQGTYPAKPEARLGGYIEYPRYTRGAWTVRGIRIDTAPRITIDGVRVVSPTPGVHIGSAASTLPETTTVQNSVVDGIGRGGMQRGNVTNGRYSAP